MWIIKNQFARRNITPYQRAELALMLGPLLENEAKKRQAATQLAGRNLDGSPKFSVNHNCGEPSKPQVSKQIAKTAGVSHRIIEEVKFIKAQAIPELQAKAAVGDISIHSAAAIAELPHKEQEQASYHGFCCPPFRRPSRMTRHQNAGENRGP